MSDFIDGLVRSGFAFCSDGSGNSATNANVQVCGLSLFNPVGSGKTLYVYSLQCMYASGGFGGVFITSTDPSGGAGFTNIPTTLNIPGVTSHVAIGSVSNTPSGQTTSVGSVGTHLQQTGGLGELIGVSYIVLSPGHGIAVFQTIPTAGNFCDTVAKWCEQ